MNWKRCTAILLGLCLACQAMTAIAQDEVAPEQLLQEAMEAFDGEDFATAADKLKKYTAQVKDNGLAWFQLGYALHISGKLDEAIPAHKKATEFPQFRSTALYNLGCAYSLQDKPEESLKYLHAALDSGFDQFEMFDTDSDLDNAKKAKGFAEIKARVANGGKRLPAPFDMQALVGNWQVTAGTRAGEKVDAERLPPEIRIDRKELIIPSPSGEFVMSFKFINDKANPVEIDFTIEEGPAPGASTKAILKLDGDTATLCYHPEGAERPEKFESTADNGFFLFVMKKKSAGTLQPSDLVGEWKITGGQKAGEEPSEQAVGETITFDKETVTVPAGGGENFLMGYKLVPDTDPVQINLEIKSGPVPSGKAVGIIQMRDGELVLCYNPMGEDRPEKFESNSENGFYLFRMKKFD